MTKRKVIDDLNKINSISPETLLPLALFQVTKAIKQAVQFITKEVQKLD